MVGSEPTPSQPPTALDALPSIYGAKVFRVFVSSTFRDMVAEREALHARVFPRLRALCEQHGCQFQAVDLRWVGEAAELSQLTMGICLEEIARCRDAGSGPSLIALVGDRRGWCPLPESIDAADFDAVAARVVQPADRRLLDDWYPLDANAQPPTRILMSRESVAAEQWTEVGSLSTLRLEIPLSVVALRAA